MDKRQAKKVIYAYLAHMLNPVNYGEYLLSEARGNRENYRRLLEAVEEILSELERRAEDKR